MGLCLCIFELLTFSNSISIFSLIQCILRLEQGLLMSKHSLINLIQFQNNNWKGRMQLLHTLLSQCLQHCLQVQRSIEVLIRVESYKFATTFHALKKLDYLPNQTDCLVICLWIELLCSQRLNFQVHYDPYTAKTSNSFRVSRRPQ